MCQLSRSPPRSPCRHGSAGIPPSDYTKAVASRCLSSSQTFPHCVIHPLPKPKPVPDQRKGKERGKKNLCCPCRHSQGPLAGLAGITGIPDPLRSRPWPPAARQLANPPRPLIRPAADQRGVPPSPVPQPGSHALLGPSPAPTGSTGPTRPLDNLCEKCVQQPLHRLQPPHRALGGAGRAPLSSGPSKGTALIPPRVCTK